MYVEILHCRMWEAERKQIKYLYLAAAIMLAAVGVQLALHVVHNIGQVDEPSILVIAEHVRYM